MQSKIFPLFLLLLLSFSGCANYHVVLLESFRENSDSGVPKRTTYAVTKNNMIIPEYVVDRKGNYPEAKETAWQLFQERKESLEPLVSQKYATENNFTYQTRRWFFGIGFTIVSPIALPVMYVGKWLSHKNPLPSDENNLTKQYFEMAFHESMPLKPKLKNEFEL